jgi:hypothetical protein
MGRANLRAGRSLGESLGKAIVKETNKRIKEQRNAEAKAAAKEEPAPRITFLTELPGPISWWRQGEQIAVGVQPRGIQEFEKLSPKELSAKIVEIGGKPKIWSVKPAARELERFINFEYNFNRKVDKVYRNAVYAVFREQLRRVSKVFVPGKPKGLIKRIVEKLRGT